MKNVLLNDEIRLIRVMNVSIGNVGLIIHKLKVIGSHSEAGDGCPFGAHAHTHHIQSYTIARGGIPRAEFL